MVFMHFYVGTVNGPTSITRLGSFENVAKIYQFQFLDPPLKTHTNNFLGVIKQFLDPPTHTS